MGDNAFRHVLSSGRIGGLELSNRVLMPAMDMNHCDDGMITPAEIAHYTARAAGGTAMVITGSGAVAFPHGATSWHQPGLSDDRFIPGLRALAESIHAVGGRLCIQLCHHGKTSGVDTAEGRPSLVPSVPVPGFALDGLRDSTMGELMKLATATQGKPATYQVADADDLAWVVDQFAAAAERVQRAGCDAVEVHAAHGYLLSTFLSPAYNRRDDEWGGSAENRARLTADVVRAIRARVGASFPILVRINGEEFGIEGGLTPADAAELATHIAAAGADAIHVSGNAHNPFADFTEGPLPNVVGRYRQATRAVKAAVNVPVIAVGRLLPEVADEMIAAGDCDFVSMGRQLLADPDLVGKLRAGNADQVRPCINCYVCVEQNFFDSPPRCAVNPALGNEGKAAIPVTVSDDPQQVVVVGGGPAGMEAARLAALRGHRVTLIERASRLGGTAWFSQLTTPANEPLVQWLERELQRVGVTVMLNTVATVASVQQLHPDTVIVATGARRGLPDVPGAELPHVYTGDDLRGLITGDGAAEGSLLTRAVLRAGRALRITDDPDRIRSLSKRWMPMGQRVVVIGGGLVGLELAEFLAERNRTVTVLDEGAQMGLPMAMPRRWTAVRKAGGHGVTLVREATVERISEHEVHYRLASGEVHHVVADEVIVASHVHSDTTFADLLAAEGLSVRTIGDAEQVGYIEGAFHSAWAVAEEL
jgi:2,4-dienoyl-CoA reductase-like NADH-dependent reductase (Old Yellow Enzyme family)/NADPH-dependent 2,4-dienoyl-CoA reductase/sulfur reductase-like enzyme